MEQLSEWGDLMNLENIEALKAFVMQRTQIIGPKATAHELVMRDREMQDALDRQAGE